MSSTAERYENHQNYAEQMDAQDPLASFREQFHVPKCDAGNDHVYLVGNSLGLQPVKAEAAVLRELEDWKRLGVEGHLEARSAWLSYHELLTESLTSLVGALPTEVVAMNTLTVNLHLMMASFYRPSFRRYKILTGPKPFPSDRYAMQSQARFHDVNPDEALMEAPDMETFHEILEEFNEDIALVLVEGVSYYTGEAVDLKRCAEQARKYHIPIGFDLAHAVGNIPLQLHDIGADFAVWCHYKYCNGGPGCVGGAFVHERHANKKNLPRFAGWWGHNKERRFLMEPDFDPIPGAEGWQLSNPPILPLAALRESFALFDAAGMVRLREKSEKLTGYLEYLIKDIGDPRLSILTPEDPTKRGCQLSLVCKEVGKAVYTELRRRGVITDWREPDVIRLAPVPLYNSFSDVYRFAQILKECLGGSA